MEEGNTGRLMLPPESIGPIVSILKQLYPKLPPVGSSRQTAGLGQQLPSGHPKFKARLQASRVAGKICASEKEKVPYRTAYL